MLGFGTYGINDWNDLVKPILEIGYRSIDCARFYKNEEEVGKAIKFSLDSGQVKREELFIITKLWIDEVEDVESACKRSLARLGLDYVDLYLLHWPIAVRTV
jgi:diketogulonate reductase-like aldo/keto reductase